jgi:hypothetical protein
MDAKRMTHCLPICNLKWITFQRREMSQYLLNRDEFSHLV